MGFLDKLLGGHGKQADRITSRGVDMANSYADNIKKLGEGNNSQFQTLAKQALAMAEKYQQNANSAIASSNEQFEQSRQQQNADLASMGFTPQSNAVYANANAQNAKAKSEMAANLQNQSNMANLQAQQQGLGLAGGFYNTGFNNQAGASGNAINAQLGANSALAQMAANKYNQNMGLLGAGIGLAGSLATGGVK